MNRFRSFVRLFDTHSCVLVRGASLTGSEIGPGLSDASLYWDLSVKAGVGFSRFSVLKCESLSLRVLVLPGYPSLGWPWGLQDSDE